MLRAITPALIVASSFFWLSACASSGGGGGGATGGTGGGGGFGAMGTGGSGTGGSGAGTSSGDCQTACNKAAAAQCPNEDATTCVSDCQQTPSMCQSEYSALVNCAATSGTFQCDTDGEAELQGCDAQGSAFVGCLQSGTGGSGGGTGGGTSTLPAGCVTASNFTIGCNPVTNEGCNTAAGQACDLGQNSQGQPGLGCFDPPNDAQPGAACNNETGPFCVPTHNCSENVCKRFCCSSTDCNGGTCTALDPNLGTLGVCN